MAVHASPAIEPSMVPAPLVWSVRVVYWISSALTVLLAFGAIGTIAGVAADKWQADAVLTGSMDPAIPARSLVFATPQPTEGLKVGQVVMFTAPTENQEKIVHRIIKVGTAKDTGYTQIQTKGDANPTADPWKAQIPDETTMVVQFHVPFAGMAVTNPMVSGAVFLALLLMVFGTSVVLAEMTRDPDEDADADADADEVVLDGGDAGSKDAAPETTRAGAHRA